MLDMTKDVIINEKDNVGISLDGKEGIPAGHKFALKDIAQGEYVVKYGEIIEKPRFMHLISNFIPPKSTF